ncbi:hypothetical protein ACQP2P_28750 [Dactylosporangium sp. CA-139114]|uniref:hypothetical protein n=1 Tax=Dactylosporangium sp. CA-139114 TaxID=3239931 RepID=UPI003D966B91
MTTTARTRARDGAGTRAKDTTGKTGTQAAATQTAPQPATGTRPEPTIKAEPEIRPEPAAQRGGKETGEASQPSGAHLVTWQDVPVPHLKMPVVHIERPNDWSVAQRARWTADALKSAVGEPKPSRLLYYGGVGALAAFGVLEWPVALAAAAGVWVATHQRRPTAAG